MLISCWSAKGGAGTTVVAVALALRLARSSPTGALLVDLAGDVPAALGRPEPTGPGATGWLAAGADVPADALARLELEVGPGLSLIPRGAGGPAPSGRADVLAGLLAADGRTVVVDCGLVGPAAGPTSNGAVLAGTVLAGAASRSLLVSRACYLALRRAVAVAVVPSGVVLLREPGRALGPRDVEEVVGAPVVASIDVDPLVARAVDAGLLGSRLPKGLDRALRHAA